VLDDKRAQGAILARGRARRAPPSTTSAARALIRAPSVASQAPASAYLEKQKQEIDQIPDANAAAGRA
jgi:hypothetical protein